MKYRCITGVHRSKEYPVAASQVFNTNGGTLVYLDASGHVTTAVAATATIFGWAIVPTGMSSLGYSGSSWTSSATAGADKIPVIRITRDQEFLMPADEAVTDAMKGNACDIVMSGTIQQADVAVSVTDVLLIQDRGNSSAIGELVTDVVVRVNPAKIQADT